jgi:hypothetical protein
MKLARSLVTALAATSLISAPVLAAPVNVERSSTAAEGENLRGGLLLPLAALIAAVLAVILLTDSGDEPVSP